MTTEGRPDAEDRPRDVHALDVNGMIACNARDREAAHRAEVGGIATTSDSGAVTCRKCQTAIRRAAR